MNRDTRPVVVRQTDNGTELVETPPLSEVIWHLLTALAKNNGPCATIGDDHITFHGTNGSAIYRIIGGERYSAVIELVSRLHKGDEQPDHEEH